jgi:hypothetical protein
MVDALSDVFDAITAPSLQLCPKDIVLLLQAAGCKKEIKEREIRRVLRQLWELEPAENTFTYTCYTPDFSHGSYIATSKVGRYFTIRRELIQKLTF